MRLAIRLLVSCSFLLCLPKFAAADALDDLARDFWAWRAVAQPLTGDDIPRIDRPADWVPDWSPTSVAQRRKSFQAFEARWKRLDSSSWPVPRQVDYKLMGSALARVRWELDITRNWQKNPNFYIDQTLGAVLDRLLEPPPFDRVRSEEIVRRMGAIPRLVEDAKTNLTEPAQPMARLAIETLKNVGPRLATVARELRPLLAAEYGSRLETDAEKAATALESYRAWLKQRLPTMRAATAVGREGYVFFLKEVALMPFTPEQLLEIGRREWDRTIAFEAYEQPRNAGLPQLSLFPDMAAQMAREQKEEAAVRRYMEDKGILSVPSWAKHYKDLPLPAYLVPLEGLGVTDDLTSPTRLNRDGTSYIRPPAPTLGYFALSTARDPRPILVHEGVPGHYFQKIVSWANEDPIRRYYYDSGANEGLGFYAEEMMLQAGFFDDSPRGREIIYSFMRLRALRVEVDVKLALGQFTIDQGGDYLAKTVPMDRMTGLEDSAMYAATPGLGIAYQIGKSQIFHFLAEARQAEGDRFSLRAFHDFLWKNGNVPIALQEWEYMDRVKRAGVKGGRQ